MTEAMHDIMPAATAGKAAVLGVDWGTTRRRAFLLDAQGAVIDAMEDDAGVQATAGRHAAALAALRDGWPALADASRQALDRGQPLATVMSGMVGSSIGWCEVPYLAVDATGTNAAHGGFDLRELGTALHPVPDSPEGLAAFIVPGLRCDGDGEVDVMRGEETQLLGALLALQAQGQPVDGWYALPGTHSKWAQVRDGRLLGFSTFMTGELFALLSRQGTLASAMEPQDQDDEAAFLRGVAAAGRQPLSQALFAVRAEVVSGRASREQARSRLSGLLIGEEWQHARRSLAPGEPVTVIAAPALTRWHTLAAQAVGLSVQPVDPAEAHRRAIHHLAQCAARAA